MRSQALVDVLQTGLGRQLVLSVALVAMANGVAIGQRVAPVTVERSAQHTIESTAVGDAFVIQVRLPASYFAGGKNYPVMYVLDGDKCFGLAADTADWLAWAKEAPELIVVGIGYGEGRDWWQKRSRDLTPTPDASKIWGEWPLAGGAAKFQDFLSRELFPLIESRYRALPEGRAIAGVSLGGLFGVFSLLTRPTLFQRYVLVSPAFVWDNKRLWQVEADYRTKSKVLPATVFTAVGTEDTAAILRPWTEFGQLIEDRHYERLRWIMHSYADESHISVLPGALSRGIKRVFEK